RRTQAPPRQRPRGRSRPARSSSSRQPASSRSQPVPRASRATPAGPLFLSLPVPQPVPFEHPAREMNRASMGPLSGDPGRLEEARLVTRTSAALQWRRSSILLAGLLAASAAGGAEPFKEEPKAAWRSGPVRYILTVDEDKAYKALKTDDERAKAIEQFWSRRDPTPGTPQNEYKERFFKLVEEADKHFREGAGAGWTS